MEIISDGLLELGIERNVSENYDSKVRIHSWSGDSNISSEADTLVVDLDLGSYTNNSGVVPVFGGNSGTLRERIEGLRTYIPQFLEAGGTVIALLSNRVRVAGWNSSTNFDWLDDLQCANINSHGARQRYRVAEERPGVETYFNFVDWTQFGVLLNEQVVTNPKILAVNSLDHETLAVSVNEYADPNGVRRQTPGSLTLLPRPTHPTRDLFSLLDALNEIGDINFETESRPLDNRFTPDELEEVLERGETQVVEYKQEFPETAQKVAKEIVALANRSGGVLVLGVADEGEITGLDDPARTRERITGVVNDNVEPIIDIRVEEHTVEDSNILIVAIPEATQKPYGVDGTYYIRDDTNTRKLSPSELQGWFD